MHTDCRWKQRFQNFEKSFLSMQELVPITSLTKTERAALIKYFEMTFKLSWKVLKDYLEEAGYNPKSPQETLKQALQMELITEGYEWLNALDKRNLTTHTYDEAISQEVALLIQEQFAPLLQKLYQHFKPLYDQH